MKTPLLFVYGTLRREAGKEVHELLRKNGRYQGRGTVRGKLFRLDGYPGLVLSNNAEDTVVGEVYRLDNEHIDKTLSELDEYEGMGHSDPPPHEYRRETVSVRMNGSIVDAWAYVMNRSPEGRPRIQSGDFLDQRVS